MSLQAQVFVKHDATGANNGTSWQDAYTDLEAALSNTATGEIWVAAGTYKPSELGFYAENNIDLYGGFAGSETTLSERNPAANVTVLNGDIAGDDLPGVFTSSKDDNALRVLLIGQALNHVTVDGFTIKGGNTNDIANGAPEAIGGGGILALSPVTVANCHFNNNFGRSGGGVFLGPDADGSEINNCTFSNNFSTASGAAISLNGTADVSISGSTISDNKTTAGALYMNACSAVAIDDCQFTGNTNETASNNAGAFFSLNCTNVTLTNSEFADNSAPSGGALYYDADGLSGITDPENFVIENCNFHDNFNTASVGGAMRVRRGPYRMEGCIFENNSSVSSGGHIRNDVNLGDKVIYRNCQFRGGSSGGWGGAYTAYADTVGVQFIIENCIHENNSATRLGGAVNCGFSGEVVFEGCTFKDNKADGTASGGAIGMQNNGTTVFALNCTFAGNHTTGQGGAIFCGAAESSSALMVDKCQFLANQSDGFGGAIHIGDNGVNNDGSLMLSNSNFDFNQAVEQGGAINISDANTTITSCLFTNNIATSGATAPTGRGGAIAINVDSTHLEVAIINSTFVNNIGVFAAGISNWTGAEDVSSSNTVLQNNIFMQDGAVNYAVEAGNPALVSNGGNLYDDASLEPFMTHPKDFSEDNPEAVFANFSDDDFHLKLTSPAIDAGVDDGAPEFDLEGNPRINAVDLGAFENQNVVKTTERLLENNGMLALAPNPAPGASVAATLDNEWEGLVEIRLSNPLGQVIEVREVQKTGSSLKVELPIGLLQRGVYNLAFSNGEQVVVEQLLKL
jgi:hypothetical protein